MAGQIKNEDESAYSWTNSQGEYRLDDEPLTVEDEMQGVTTDGGQGGSGATGGDLTGERTPGGMSEDLTSGRAGGGFYGGPTGGVYFGDNTDHIEFSPVGGDRTYSSPETDAELAKKIAAENTRQIWKEKKPENR